jgi:hypothetical protein
MAGREDVVCRNESRRYPDAYQIVAESYGDAIDSLPLSVEEVYKSGRLQSAPGHRSPGALKEQVSIRECHGTPRWPIPTLALRLQESSPKLDIEHDTGYHFVGACRCG